MRLKIKTPKYFKFHLAVPNFFPVLILLFICWTVHGQTLLQTPSLKAPLDKSLNQPIPLMLTWDSLEQASSYSLQISRSSNFPSTSLEIFRTDLTTPSIQISSLQNNTLYYWRVNASNETGTSAWSSTRSFTTIVSKPPSPVLGLPVNMAVGQPISTTLSWYASAFASTYSVQVATNPLFEEGIVWSQNNITGLRQGLSGLDFGKTYYWRVSATNTAGTSDWSSVNSFSTQIPAPQLLSPDSGSIQNPNPPTLTWNPVDKASTYALQISSDANFVNIAYYQIGITTTMLTPPSLASNKTYFWRVQATNSDGTSNWSLKRSFTTAIPAPQIPKLGFPTHTAINQNINTLFTWNPVSSASSYTLQVSRDSVFAPSDIIYHQSNLTSPQQTINELNHETMYFWRVSATNSSGTSDWSNFYSFKTNLAPPVLLTPSDQEANKNLVVTLNWSPISVPATYGLQVSTDSTFTLSSAYIYRQNGMIQNSQTITGLVPSKKYFWRVNAKTASGDSSVWSQKFTFSTAAPGPILNSPVNGISDQSTSLFLTWKADPTLTYFNLQVSLDSTFEKDLIFVRSGIINPTQWVSGLAHNTKYYWRVSGATAQGITSEWSGVQNFSTTSAAPKPISPVTQFTKTATFQWDTISGATSYAIQIAQDSNFSNLFFERANILANSFTLNNLLSGTTYYWRVNATHLKGTGIWSPINTFMTLADPPTMLSPINFTTSQTVPVTFSWKAIPKVDYYALQIATDSNFENPWFYTSSTNSKVINDLLYETKYFYRISVTNAGGTSAWSNIMQFTTGIAPPAVPTLGGNQNTLSKNTFSILFAWDSVYSAIHYSLQVATDSSFKTIIYTKSEIDSTKLLVAGLPSGVPFYWRVSATNAGGVSAWSLHKKADLNTTGLHTNKRITEFSIKLLGNASISPYLSFAYQVPSSLEGKKAKFEIYTSYGKKISQTEQTLSPKGIIQIPIKNKFNPGVYYLKIVTNQSIHHKQLQISK